jgi:anaerobic magnesium-protoporphyrin IX monomethyl ester cyclase
MRLLLLAMPDTADVIDYSGRVPNLALVSLAGNLPGHEVKVLDLVVYKPKIRRPLEKALRDFRPQVVGLSAMTFQFDTLVRVARFIRGLDPNIKLVAGGYHASLMAQELGAAGNDLPLDFLVRGEGEFTLRDLVAELEKPEPDFSGVAGLSYRQAGTWVHNAARPLLDLDHFPLPRRQARMSQDFYFLDKPIDVAETSRGCPYNCKFCSITRMYGHTFRRFSVERIIADLENIRRLGFGAVFFVDDNITYDIDHFRRVCQAIVRRGLNSLYYSTQVSAVGIARNPELVADMKRANFHTVFVGFESMSPASLKDMKKPTSPEINRRAAALLRQHDIGIIAGVIVGYPDDTEESIRQNFQSVRALKPDMYYAQYLTPYPKTVLRQELLEAGLVVNKDDFRHYDGFSCNIRTRYLSRKDLYQVLKKEALKAYFDLPAMARNFYVRNHLRAFLRAQAKALAATCYYVLRGRQLAGQLDI